MRPRNVDLGPMSLPVGVERTPDEIARPMDPGSVNRFESLMASQPRLRDARQSGDEAPPTTVEDAIVQCLAREPDDEGDETHAWRIHLPARMDGLRVCGALDLQVCRNPATTRLEVCLRVSDIAQAEWFNAHSGGIAQRVGSRLGLSVSMQVRTDPHVGAEVTHAGAAAARRAR